MKALLLILLLAVTVSAQNQPTDIMDWKLITEMSGEIPYHPGVTIRTYGARIARGNDLVKLAVRFDFPGGVPVDLFKGNAPVGFDVSSVSRVDANVELNCQTLVVKPIKATANIYQFNGKHRKSKEPPFKIESGHIFAAYFCEQEVRQLNHRH